MNAVLPNFAPAAPEIFVLIMGCIILLVDSLQKRRAHTLTYYLIQLTLIGAAIISYNQFTDTPVLTFGNMYIQDNLSVVLKEFIYLTAFMSFIFARKYIEDTEIPYGEFYILGLFSMLGMMMLVSSYHFLTLFLGLELMSLPIYAMVALRRDCATCSEASMKYFVVGALATGMLLFGLSLMYGATQHLGIVEVANALANQAEGQAFLLTLGLVFVVVGIAFKLGAVPFHMWIPDVYQGAPSALVLFIGSAAKIAAVGLIIRLLGQAMPSLFIEWQQLLIITAVLSLVIGNVVAIVQSNIKRMLGYSSIAHIGYFLLGIIAGTKSGYAASTFYMLTYAIMTLGGFGMILMLTRSGVEAENIDDFKGLNQRNPWLAFLMLLVMFSMAGIPPLVGFWAKVAVLEALVNVNLEWLAVVAIILSVVGVFYYIRVVKVMYFDDAQTPVPYTYSKDMQAAISVSGLALLALGIFPGLLFDLCKGLF